MGLGHPDLMRDALTQRQVMECWDAYCQEPWGEERQDYRFAHSIQSSLAMQPTAKGKKPKLPSLKDIKLKFTAAGPTKSSVDQFRENHAMKLAVAAKKKHFREQQAEVERLKNTNGK